jgi:hypothetical protein
VSIVSVEIDLEVLSQLTDRTDVKEREGKCSRGLRAIKKSLDASREKYARKL